MNAKKRVADIIESALSDLGRQHSIMWEFGTTEFGWVGVHFWLPMKMEHEGYILHGGMNEVRVTPLDTGIEVKSPWFMVACRPVIEWVDRTNGPLNEDEVRKLVNESVEALDAQIASRRATLEECVRRDRERSIRVD